MHVERGLYQAGEVTIALCRKNICLSGIAAVVRFIVMIAESRMYEYVVFSPKGATCTDVLKTYSNRSQSTCQVFHPGKKSKKLPYEM
jgi:hypothetical protein